ncbi:hypothetical protein [Dactylosporangium sp. CS-033363]|uniref:hypothetical protein n=1 Tax=Dactylosporangium sp. CS-033363 TaxID=3239935 RepID=UPI003D8E650D
MSAQPKRIPGQSNADYENRRLDPNAQFIGEQSLHGGGGFDWVGRLWVAAADGIAALRQRRRTRKLQEKHRNNRPDSAN